MRKGQNRDINIVGRVGCLGLLGLGLALVNPVSNSAYAEEVEDYGIDAQTVTNSTVSISLAPSSAAERNKAC